MGTPAVVYGILFTVSIVYALILEYLKREYQESYDDLVWLMVVIGDGYVLLGLRVLFAAEEWLLICGAFAAAGAPIVARSLINIMQARKRLADRLENLGRGGDDAAIAVATERRSDEATLPYLGP